MKEINFYQNFTLIPQIRKFPAGTAMLLVFVAVTVSIELTRRKKLKL